jgi:lantibiotic biosynthesis protein
MSTTEASAQFAITVAERLLDPGQVMAAAPGRPRASLQGLAGTALLHARLSAVSPVFAEAARAHWAAAARDPGTARPGIFAAPGGMATSLIIGHGYLADPEPQLPAIAKAVRWLSAQATQAAATWRDQSRCGTAVPSWALYDVITGLSGTGRILLAAIGAGHSEAEQGLRAALETLIAIITTPRSRTRPGWWLPAGGHPSAGGAPPSGVAETGAAHGIAGPLALMSIAASARWLASGQAGAIRAAADWLMQWREADALTWPPYVTGTELDSARPAPAPGRRDAWCYGAAGIGRALIMAGHALADPALTTAGESAYATLSSRPARDWDTEGPTLCHGTSGVLQSAATAGQAATTELAAAATAAAHAPKSALGFQHHHAGARSDDPGILTGAAGIALALADHGQLPAPPGSTGWDALLLLS